MKNWWAEKPFDVQGSMNVPIFSFNTASFANKSIGKYFLIQIFPKISLIIH